MIQPIFVNQILRRQKMSHFCTLAETIAEYGKNFVLPNTTKGSPIPKLSYHLIFDDLQYSMPNPPFLHTVRNPKPDSKKA